MKLPSRKGFTLIELVVVMGIFSLVIVMVGNSFGTLFRYSTRFMKTEESNIEGNVGLEVMRHDISSAGFGLPTSFNGGPPNGYTEVDTSHALAAGLNDTTAVHADGIPRAVAGAGNIAAATDTGSDGVSYRLLGGTDYLALKATSLGTEAAGQKWTYAGYTSLPPKRPKTWVSGNLATGDRVIALNRSAASADGGYTMLKDASGKFWTSYDPAGLGAGFSALTPQDMVYIYGIAGSGITPRMPFNRADYFVATPPAGMLPNYCAPNTGVLYRGMVRHVDGSLEYQPLVDCVAAMHVVLGWNMVDSTGALMTQSTQTASGAVDTWSTLDGSSLSSSSSVPINQLQPAVQAAVGDAGQVRTKLKVVKVYLLVQNGKQDPTYTSPATSQLYTAAEEGALGPAATYTLGADMLNYRWKVYKLVIRPKNLVANQ